ncbi:MAG: hypothetical protein ACP5MD_13600, partial [Verrucomicrobiia bacterium]
MTQANAQLVSAPAQPNRKPKRTDQPVNPATPQNAAGQKLLRIERVFSSPSVNPFDEVEWEKRTAEITDDTGKAIFRQEGV